MATSKTGTRGLRVWAGITALMLQWAAFAAAAGNTDPRVDYDKRIKDSQNVGVLGKDVAGDRVNFYTGSTSFAAEDLSIPGNSALPVAVGRVYPVEFNHMVAEIYGAPNQQVVETVRQYAFGDWDMDIPYLTARFHQSEGWQIDSTTPLNRCSVLGQVKPNAEPSLGLPKPAPNPYNISFSPFQGYTLHAGGQDQSLLLASVAGVSKPSAGGPYHWLTKDNWWVSCLPSIANGVGEGFLAIAPDGTKYRFDWMSRRNVTHIEKEVSIDPEDQGKLKVFYTYAADYFLMPTRVEDRFGNYVTYAYSNDAFARLLSVTGSDGRQLTLGYNPQGFVSSLSDGTHTVTYEYAGTSLSRVVLPDGSAWQYGFSNLSQLRPSCQPVPCDEELPIVPVGTPTGYAVHPAGARVDFTFDTHFQYSGENLEYGYPLGIKDKTISGPGLPVQTWRYAYGMTGAEYWNLCVLLSQCPTRVWTDEVSPDYAITRRMFGLVPFQDQSMLLQELQGVIPTTANAASIPPYSQIAHSLRGGDEDLADDPALPAVVTPIVIGPPQFYSETDYFYAAGAQAVKVGVNPLGGVPGLPSQIYASERYIPTTQRKVHRDGVAFTWQANSFDTFANPLSVTRLSTLGYTRTDVTAYYHDYAKWVIGQVASSTNTDSGLVESQTDYWPATALPQRIWSFGKARQYFEYNANGTLAKVVDGNNHATLFANWKRGIPQTITFADNATKSAVVDNVGQITSVTNEVGAKTCYGYDAMGRISSITHPSEVLAGACNQDNWLATTITFAPSGSAVYGLPAGHWRRTEATGNARKIAFYDAMWRPVVQEVYDATNTANTLTQTVTRYDSEGRTILTSYPQRTLDPNIYNTWANPAVVANLTGSTQEYDALGRPTIARWNSELGVLFSTTQYLNNFVTLATDARGQQTSTHYMAFDQPTTDWPNAIAHPEGAFTDIIRDLFGKPRWLTRRNSTSSLAATRTYVYDAHQQLCKTIDPETGSTAMGYDNAGNLAWSAAGLALPSTNCDAASVPVAATVSRTYDARDRIQTLAFPDGLGNQTWTYTADGLPEQVTTQNSGVPAVNTYTYNRRRLMTGEGIAQAPGYSWGIGYGYNVYGHRTVVQYPNGQVLNLTPNALGQTVQVGSPGQDYATAVSYYPNGAIQQFTYGNGILHTLTQNARQRPDTSCDFFGSCGAGAALNDGYDYDANGNVASISDGTTGNRGNRTMTYDGLDRLKTVASPMYGTIGANYSYDVLDNLTRVNIGGTAMRDHYYCYDANWRLTNVKTGSCNGTSVIGLGYDAQGNLANKNGQLFQFDTGNRLRQATGLETYRYDAHGRRIQATAAQAILSQYNAEGALLYQQDDRRGLNLNYVHLGGSLIAIREQPTLGGAVTVKYQHTDALGSPVAVTDANRVVIEKSEYEPYGGLLNRPLKDGPGYTGHVSDAATGLSYMQQRYYDPLLAGGRFLSVDPVTATSVGGNFNRYWYANNNPYKFVDPDGREVRFASNSPADFLRNIAAAIRYLNSNGLANGIGYVHASKEVVTIVPASDRSDIYANTYDGNTNTLYWADKAALEMVNPTTGETGRRSPALILGHEFEHAANHLANPKGFAKDIKTPDSTFDNQEERNVIEEYENPGAQKLGEPTRNDHDTNGKSVLSKCIKEVCP